MRRVSVVGRLAALAAALAPVPARAQPPAAAYAGLPVVAVSVEVEGRPATDAAVTGLIETAVGAPLSVADVRETIAHLFGLGRYEDIEVHAARAAGGVALRYALVPLHAVSEIRFRGDLGLAERDLRRIVVERFGPAPPAGRADAAARLLERAYAERGYLQARVTPSVDIRHDPDRGVMIFDVAPGPRARIGRVAVTGLEGAAARELLARLGLVEGGAYEPARLRRRLDEYLERLRRQGRYLAEGDHTAAPRDDARTVDVAIDVDPGPVVRLEFTGDPLPADRIDELVPVAREGAVDEDLLEDSDRRIREFLTRQGYWKAEVRHTRAVRGGELVVTFTIVRGPRYIVDGLELAGHSAMPIERLRPMLHLARGDPFVETTLQADVAAIRDAYLREGFRDVAIDTTVEERPGGRVFVRVRIAEGPRARVGAVRFEGRTAIDEGQLRAILRLRPGAPYYEPAAAADREAVLLEYLNRGYRAAAVTLEPHADESRGTVDLIYAIREGPRFVVDRVVIVGNARTSAETIRRALVIREGAPAGLAALVESRRRLTELGLFRRVRLTEIAHSRGTRRDVIVTVEEADATTIGYGAGVEVGQRLFVGAGGFAEERLELAPRGAFEVTRRNLWGKNRSVSLFSRVGFRSRGQVAGAPSPERFSFLEYRLVGTLREPSPFGWNAEGALTASAEQALRTSFNFVRQGLVAELVHRATPAVRISGRYSLGRTRLFDVRLQPEEALLIDRLFPQLRLSTAAAAVVRDTRDDPLDPARGALVANDLEIAARGLGSQVGFAKTYFQAFGFRALSSRRRVVLAAGVRLGVAAGFPREVVEGGRPVEVRDVPAAERFFAGGPTTVRGFALDKLGAPDTIGEFGFPKGGNAVLVLNAELRAPLWRDLGIVGFFDAGNVFARATDLELGELRPAAGVGLRYRSPLGPIRFDLGFKLDRQLLPQGGREGLTAFHVGIGHAF
ncbi:MAG TPA: POTRA domain-containing protein [Vicinamibacterales bacterium]|nr:POTRA domain-containing protein [Vicinamibacterales bacterium]